MKSFLGNFYRHLVIFSDHTDHIKHFFKYGPNPAAFVYFHLFLNAVTNIEQSLTMWTRRWCSWDSNPRLQDGRRRQICWVMVAPDIKHFSIVFCDCWVQQDQMSRLFFQYLAIYDNENWLFCKIFAKVGSKFCEILNKPSNDWQSGGISPHLVTLDLSRTDYEVVYITALESGFEPTTTKLWYGEAVELLLRSGTCEYLCTLKTSHSYSRFPGSGFEP